MVQDIINTINTLKNTAFGRCRHRIEEAAQKAREVREGGQPKDDKRSESCETPCGVTSIMKRKHGL